MSKCDDLLESARNNPRGLRFDELVKLAECFDFFLARQRGSHAIYKREGYRKMMNFQPRNGMAKPAQVRELLAAIDELTES